MKWSADPAILRQPVHLLAFGFGAGLSPWAPGTFGTLVAVPIVAGVMLLGPTAHIAFDDHPDSLRFSGRIETVTVDSAFEWLQQSAIGEKVVVVR